MSRRPGGGAGRGLHDDLLSALVGGAARPAEPAPPPPAAPAPDPAAAPAPAEATAPTPAPAAAAPGPDRPTAPAPVAAPPPAEIPTAPHPTDPPRARHSASVLALAPTDPALPLTPVVEPRGAAESGASGFAITVADLDEGGEPGSADLAEILRGVEVEPFAVGVSTTSARAVPPTARSRAGLADDALGIEPADGVDRTSGAILVAPAPDRAIAPGAWPAGLADTLVAELRDELAAAATPRQAAAHAFELGRLLFERLERRDEALEAWEEALRLSPGFGPALRALHRARAGDPGTARRALPGELATCPDAAARLALLLESARRAHGDGDLGAAEEDLREALVQDPGCPLALAALAALQRTRGDRGAQRAAVRQRAELCRDDRLRAALLVAAARLAEDPAGDEPAALLASASALDPGNGEAAAALTGVLRGRGRFAELAALYEQRAGSAGDPLERTAALRRAARLHRGRLQARDRAVACLERAVEIDAHDRLALVELCDLYEEAGRFDLFARALEQLAGAVVDRGHRAALWARLGEVAADELGDQPRAIEALERALAEAPDHRPARRRLGALYQRAGRHRDLCALLVAEAQNADPDSQAAAHLRIAELYEGPLGNPEQAIAHYRHALTALPAFRPALRALARLCSATGRFAELVRIYEQELDAVLDTDDRAHLLRHIAALREERLGDEAGAAAACEQLRALTPHSVEPLRTLDRLYRRAARYQELVPVLDGLAALAPGPDRAAAALCESGRVLEQHLGRPEEALERYRFALAQDAVYLPALLGAGRLCQRLGRHADLVEIHRVELRATADPERQAALHYAIGELCELHLARPDDAAAAYAVTLRLAPHHQLAREALGRLLETRGAWANLVDLEEGLPEPTAPALRAAHHHRLARLLADRLDAGAAAAEHYQRALAAAPDDATAVLALADLLERRGEPAALLRFLRTAASASEHRTAPASDPVARAALGALVRLGRALGRDARPTPDVLDEAVGCWERLLRRAPECRLALHELDHLFASLARDPARAAVLDRARLVTTDPGLAAALLLERAALEERLNRPREATDGYEQALALSPRHPVALAALERLHAHGGNALARARVLRELASTSAAGPPHAGRVVGGEEAAAYLAESGQLADGLGQPVVALEAYAAALAQDPGCLPALFGAARLHAARREPAALADTLERHARACHDPLERARLLCAAARVLRDERDEAAAVRLLREVLHAAPQHPVALRTLEEIFVAREAFEDLVVLLEHAARHLDGPALKRDLWLRVAHVAEERLARPAKAREALREAAALDPHNRAVLETRARLARECGDAADLADALEQLVAVTGELPAGRAGPDGVEHRRTLHLELGLLYDEQLARPEPAARHLRRALELDPQDRRAADRLALILTRAGHFPEAAALTESLCRTEDDRERKLGLQLRLSDLRERGFGDVRGAIAAAEAARALDPSQATVTERLVELLRRAGDLGAAGALLDSAVALHRARVPESPLRAAPYEALCRLFTLQGEADRARTTASLLGILGAAAPAAEPATPPPLAGGLADEDLARHLLHPGERGALGVLLARIEPAILALWPLELATFGASPAGRITARSSRWLHDRCAEVASAFGLPGFELYVTEARPEVLAVVPGSPPQLVMGAGWVAGVLPAEQRSALGRLVGRARLGHAAAAETGAERLGQVIGAVLALTLPPGAPPTAFPGDASGDLAKRVRKGLGRAGLRDVGLYALEVAGRNLDPGACERALRASDDRAGILCAGDLGAAFRAMLRLRGTPVPLEEPLDHTHLLGLGGEPGVLEDVLGFAVSDEHFLLRQRLGLSEA
ncbi:MAG TPA: hypothetical protein VGQ83_06855 [Polyangia bacterium]|jgi:tetratricopeptide (TPR) repeat protein